MKNADRRALTLNTLDDVVAEVERLARGEVTAEGKHSFPQIVRHLALSINMMTGRLAAPNIPLIMKLILPLIRSKILKGPVKPGVRLPADAEAVFWSDEEISVRDAIEMLKESVEYYKSQGPLPVHPIFGKASRDQMDRIACSHAAMHLSFVHPS